MPTLNDESRRGFHGRQTNEGFCDYGPAESRGTTHQAIKLPEGIELEEASLIEPLACCLHSIKRAQISPGDTVAVLGAGTMGTLHLLLAKLDGARTVVSDLDERRLSFARKQGADL